MFNISLAKSIVALTTCLVTICPFIGFAQHLIMHDRKFYKMLDKSLVGKVTVTRKVKDYFDCSFLCLEHGPLVCLSFNFGRTNNNGYYTCELSNSERYLEPQRLEEQSSYDYYGTTTEVGCKDSSAMLSMLHTWIRIRVSGFIFQELTESFEETFEEFSL